ncbi:sensor histidine kinase [Alkalihalobacillus sp. AL-G]|uniref:HAMP domain-containing sensor histidine kinase n=1 Tax=Alkalihalobacillus sp. AL-G TaxID=2926399 RepID=UPI00272AF3EF|nr:sensor histidine kinase [Alkalihalobacillus sp. AL-G]WLD92511.1 sensor histidine kinase [Alkalihalobacillus sp. AL-G]
MNNKQSGVRATIYRTHLLTSVYTTVLVFFLFQIFYYFNPDANRIYVSVVVCIAVFLLSLVLGMYFSFKRSQDLIDRLNEILVGVAKLSRGNYEYRIEVLELDEIGTISHEINELSEKIEKQVQSLQKLANEKANLAEKAHTAATIEERQRLARDLHDAVSQQLFALNMMSSAAFKLFDSKPDAAKDQLEQVVELANKAQGEMRALLLHLRPVELSGESLSEGIKGLVAELRKKSGIEIESEIMDTPELTRGIEDHLFRLVQESLANALRHSRASKLTINLQRTERHILLHIRDNGIGFDPNQTRKTSYGLKTMQERCDEIGGTFSIKSAKDHGTTIDVRVPIQMGDEVNGNN